MVSIKISRKAHSGGIGRILEELEQSVEEGTRKAAEQTQKLAIRFSRGEVKRSIQIEVVNLHTEEVKGRVYTNSPFSAFLEYGTGIFMEPNPLGHIPGSAGDRGEPWFVHEDLANLDGRGYQEILTPVGKYYMIWGTHAHPYMQPAAFKSRDRNVETVAEEIRALIREARA